MTTSNEATLSTEPVILASASTTRRAILEDAGITVECIAANIDEREIKRSLTAAGDDGAQIALALAETKARSVARSKPGQFVIGADQILECDGELYDKPAARAEAAAQLARISGRRHDLVSAVCVIRDGQILWHHIDRAQMHMRPLSADFIDRYLAAAGDAVLDGPGAYRIESLGSHLFTRVDGDHFTVLGLPLLPLLGFLREHRVVPS